MDGTSSTGNVVRFPARRRRRTSVADIEDILRQRWQDVVNEPIPGRWLQLISLFERVEAERSPGPGEAFWTHGTSSIPGELIPAEVEPPPMRKRL